MEVVFGLVFGRNYCRQNSIRVGQYAYISNHRPSPSHHRNTRHIPPHPLHEEGPGHRQI